MYNGIAATARQRQAPVDPRNISILTNHAYTLAAETICHRVEQFLLRGVRYHGITLIRIDTLLQELEESRMEENSSLCL